MNASEQKVEWLACSESPIYFLHNYVHIYDAIERKWVPFKLWKSQVDVLEMLVQFLLVIILKARQLGLTWLVLGYALWLMLFRAAATVLVFSKRDDEAVYLLGPERLRGMYNALPDFLKARTVESSNDHEWILSNGSSARAFPTTAGDSYTATLAIVDEADLVPNLGKLMNAVKPTIDAGGQMVLLSRANKDTPQSEFKRIYRAAKEKLNGWHNIFLPWQARPDRTAEWFEAQKQEIFYRTGSNDDLFQQYPSSEEEALLPRSLNKRIAPNWVRQCYEPQNPLTDLPSDAPAIPGLAIYKLPELGRNYFLGIDPAEGNPTSDDSAFTVLDDLGEEVASLAGKYQPSVIASHADEVGVFFLSAGVLVERNNHGHAVLLWFNDYSKLKVLDGWDKKAGWLSNSRGKTLLYDSLADSFREHDTKLHSFAGFNQISSIEGATLRAPEGEADDRADSYALANVARLTGKPLTGTLFV